MYFYYKKQDGQVAMRSDGLMKLECFDVLSYVPTESELGLINQNYDQFVEEGKLVIKKPERVLTQERADQIEVLKSQIIEKQGKGTLHLNDVVEFIKTLN